MAVRCLRSQEFLAWTLPMAWRGKKMNLVRNKKQNSSSCILALPIRASLEDLLMKWLPEDERRKEHPRAIRAHEELSLGAKRGPGNQQAFPCWSGY